MSRTLSEETLLWLLRLNARGSAHDRNLIEAIIQEHLDWRNPYGPRVYLRDIRAERTAAQRKGGRHPKRRLWAEALAKALAATATAQEAWNAIPEFEDSGDDTVEAAGQKWIVYRDGNRLIGTVDRTGAEESISRSTFLKRYLKRNTFPLTAYSTGRPHPSRRTGEGRRGGARPRRQCSTSREGRGL
jgi:hypothetical protein